MSRIELKQKEGSTLVLAHTAYNEAPEVVTTVTVVKCVSHKSVDLLFPDIKELVRCTYEYLGPKGIHLFIKAPRGYSMQAYNDRKHLDDTKAATLWASTIVNYTSGHWYEMQGLPLATLEQVGKLLGLSLPELKKKAGK